MVELTADQQEFMDELLWGDTGLWPIMFYNHVTRCGLKQAVEAVHNRQGQLGIDFNGASLSRRKAFESLAAIQGAVVIIEGSWDGDSDGWFILLSAITLAPSQQHPRYTEHGPCDVRGLEKQVERARDLSEELAEVAGVDFYLTSVTEDDTLRWWDTQST